MKRASALLGVAGVAALAGTLACAPTLEPKPAPPELSALRALERGFEYAATAIGPSVVSIYTTRESTDASALSRMFGGGGKSLAVGSGVIVDEAGHILTNNHVVADATLLEVELHTGRRVPGTLVGTDPKSEVAVIKIERGDLQPAVLADSEDVRVGQWVLAVGSPFGLSQTVTAGIVSATGRESVGIAEYEDFIQTDAAINRGNSGGPLVDLEGHVVGINTAIASRNGGSMGIGFSIPIDLAVELMKQLIETGKVQRGFLGISFAELDPEAVKEIKEAKPIHGMPALMVTGVLEDGPAAKAGVRSGDVIVEIGGDAVDNGEAFRREVARLSPGSKVKLRLWRDGKFRSVTITLGDLEQR